MVLLKIVPADRELYIHIHIYACEGHKAEHSVQHTTEWVPIPLPAPEAECPDTRATNLGMNETLQLTGSLPEGPEDLGRRRGGTGHLHRGACKF